MLRNITSVASLRSIDRATNSACPCWIMIACEFCKTFIEITPISYTWETGAQSRQGIHPRKHSKLAAEAGLEQNSPDVASCAFHP